VKYLNDELTGECWKRCRLRRPYFLTTSKAGRMPAAESSTHACKGVQPTYITMRVNDIVNRCNPDNDVFEAVSTSQPSILSPGVLLLVT